MSSETPEPIRAETPEEAERTRPAGGGYLSFGIVSGLLSAMVGGVIAWGVLLALYPAFEIPAELRDLPPTATAEQVAAQQAARMEAHSLNSLFAVAVLGGLIGGSLWVAEGVARRSALSLAIGAVICLIVGGVLGGLGGWASNATLVAMNPANQPVTLIGTVLGQIVALGLMGAGIGLGIGVATWRARAVGHCLVCGTLAGLLAGLCFPILIGIAMPSAQTELTVPLGAMDQLIWIVIMSGFLGVLIPVMASGPKEEAETEPSAMGQDEDPAAHA